MFGYGGQDQKAITQFSSRFCLPKIIQVGRFLTELIKNTRESFCPCDAMLARVIAAALCVCLSVSVCLCRCFIETHEWIELVLAWELPSVYPIHVLKGNSHIFKNKGTSLWKIVQNFGLRTFCFGISSSKRVIDFAGRRWTFGAS